MLIFSILSFSAFAQDANSKKTVSGTIVDVAGIPLPGVNIIEKGTSNGVVSDFDGKFSLSVKSKSTLVFTFIGMKKAEYSVDGKSVFNITLQEDTQSLNEVVVVGYGTQKREAVTGSVATVKMSEIEDLPVGNLASALVGRVLGVSVTGGDSRPGGSAQIVIRNPLEGNDITAKDGSSTDPLYVIDGVVQINPDNGRSDPTLFNNLDASEVESISFLKDASAAIYGSRGSQGVVLVTTKRGKKGTTRFSYSGNFSYSDETYRTKMLNAYDYGKVFNIMNGANGLGRTYDTSRPDNNQYFFSDKELDYFKTLKFNVLDDYWTSSGNQRHNFNLSGGTDKATYFGGISYYTQDGNLGTLNYDKWSFRAGSNVNLSQGLKAGFQVSGYFTDLSKTVSGVGSSNEENDYRQLINRAPFLPMYINGLPTLLIGSSGNDALVGYHFGEIQRINNLNTSSDNNVSVNIDLEYELPFLKGLKLKGNYARQESNSRGSQIGGTYELYEFFGADPDVTDNISAASQEQTYILYGSGQGDLGTNKVREIREISNGSRIFISNTRSTREQTRFQATYDRNFGSHNISALVAVEKSETEWYKVNTIKLGDVPEWSTGMLWQVSNWTFDDNTYNWYKPAGDLGYIGRLNYDYDGKYYAEFLFRSDASTKFAPKNYWGNFYTLSAGWIISKESFFKSNTIDFLKFRGSIGMLGKDDAKPWQWQQNFDAVPSGGAVFGGNNDLLLGLRANGPANPDIKWGKELKTNFGVEARFLDNRLSTTIETFYNIGTKLLVNLNDGVPFTVGGASTSTNFAEVDTWGKEFSISWSDDIGKDFSYGVTFNMGWYANNKIKGNFTNPDNWFPWQEKKPGSSDIGTWGYDYLGMFKTQADIDKYIAETGVTQIIGVTAAKLKPGMLYYRDIRGPYDPVTKTFAPKDGIIDKFDQIQLKKPAKGPQGFASTFRLSYKQLSLNTVLNVGWGGYREVGSAKSSLDSDNIISNAENRPAFWANMYDPDLNPNGTIPNLSRYVNSQDNEAGGGINTVSSKFWQVSSFSLAMRNINISYSVPKKLTEKAGLSSFRLNFVAINPFVLFNPYKDYGLSPYGSYDSYPTLKTYSLGLNIGF